MKNYFETIYQIAIKKDNQALNDLLSRRVCIDEFQQGTFGLSAAAALARDGKFSAADWLRQHGAIANWIALGAAVGGHETYAENMRTKCFADVKWIAFGAAMGGHMSYAENLRSDHKANPSWIAHGAAMGGYIPFAVSLWLLHDADVARLAQGAKDGGYLNNKQRIYSLLIKIKNELCRKEIAEAFEKRIESKNLQQEIPSIVKKVKKVTLIMKKYQFDLSQAEFLCENDNFYRYYIWFLQVIRALRCQDANSLPPELFLYISKLATGLSAPQTNNLWKMFESVSFEIKQRALLKDLEPFTRAELQFSISTKIRSQARVYSQKNE